MASLVFNNGAKEVPSQFRLISGGLSSSPMVWTGGKQEHFSYGTTRSQFRSIVAQNVWKI